MADLAYDVIDGGAAPKMNVKSEKLGQEEFKGQSIVAGRLEADIEQQEKNEGQHHCLREERGPALKMMQRRPHCERQSGADPRKNFPRLAQGTFASPPPNLPLHQLPQPLTPSSLLLQE